MESVLPSVFLSSLPEESTKSLFASPWIKALADAIFAGVTAPSKRTKVGNWLLAVLLENLRIALDARCDSTLAAKNFELSFFSTEARLPNSGPPLPPTSSQTMVTSAAIQINLRCDCFVVAGLDTGIPFGLFDECCKS